MTLNRQNRKILKRAETDFNGFFRSIDTRGGPVEARDNVLEFMPGFVDNYGNLLAVVSGEWYEQVYREHSRLRTSPWDDDTIQKNVKWGMSPAFDDNDYEQAMRTLRYTGQRLAQTYGRDTMQMSATRNSRRYGRVPMGTNPCSFCVTMASRGFVYYSEETAQSVTDSHKACYCEIVAEDSEKAVGFDPEEYYKKYSHVYKSGMSTKELVDAMQAEYGFR